MNIKTSIQNLSGFGGALTEHENLGGWGGGILESGEKNCWSPKAVSIPAHQTIKD